MENLPFYKQIKNAQNTVKSMVTVKPRFDNNAFIIVRFNRLVLINVNRSNMQTKDRNRPPGQ